MRIAHFGTFDVENYGDLLFPLLIERRLAREDVEIVHVSPIGGPGVYDDARPTIPLSAAGGMRFDAVVVGGGHIVHADPTSLAPYLGSEPVKRLGYAGLWLGASVLAVERGIPLIWNAPGVPGRFGPATARLAAWAAGACDYLAVRDRRSAAHLRAAGVAGPIATVPDTAIDLPAVFSGDALRSSHREAFLSRGFRDVPARTVFVHLNGRYANEPDDVLAGRVTRIARRLEAVPILGALGACHGDDVLARRVGAQMEPPLLVLDRPRGIRELAACLSLADAYVGSSLHGLISAMAYGRPAIVVARESRRGAAKFSGLLDQRSAADVRDRDVPVVFVPSWIEAEQQIDRLRIAGAVDGPRAQPGPGARWRSRATLEEQVDAHWQRVEQALFRPTVGASRKRIGSRRALGFLVEAGGGADGWRGAVLRDQRRFDGPNG